MNKYHKKLRNEERDKSLNSDILLQYYHQQYLYDNVILTVKDDFQMFCRGVRSGIQYREDILPTIIDTIDNIDRISYQPS